MPGLKALLLLSLCIPAVSYAQDFGGTFASELVEAAIQRTARSVTYDGSYRAIAYPGGDVPGNIGVCTDLVIRSFRSLGVDLQVLVHEDMTQNFSDYPQLWGHRGPDPNIDHRRVPNLQRFFERRGSSIPISKNSRGYLPGDLVTWMLPGDLPHIGIVADLFAPNGDRPLIVHNIGAGPKVEDILFSFEITGHYRFQKIR